ncbi:MAG: response regulator [Anaerolineae bacterium]
MTTPIHTWGADDDEGVRFFLQEALQREGHTVVAVATGEAALHKLQNTFFDLAIVDLKLGGRVNGLRVLEAIRWRRRPTSSGSIPCLWTRRPGGGAVLTLKPTPRSHTQSSNPATRTQPTDLPR